MILQGIDAAWNEAKPFQVEDAKFAYENDSVVLGHETGLGKTFISMLAWSRWEQADKALIVGTLGSMATWHRLLVQWGGVTPIFLQGANASIWAEVLAAKSGVWMCTYQSFLYMMRTVQRGKPHFDLLVNDELHRVMRTRNQTWKAFKRLDINHYLGLSATWASRGPQDLFPVLNLVNHRTFSSYWRFVNTWCYVDRVEGMGTQIYGVRNESNLRAVLWSRYYRSRSWEKVGNQFRKGGDTRPVLRRSEPVPMSQQQIKLLADLDRDMIATLHEERIVTANSLAKLTRKLQIAVSPRILLRTADFGGPVDWLVEKILDDPHTVVFCPFREGLDVVKEALIKAGRSAEEIFILRGGTRPEEINNIVTRWKACRGVVLCTLAFAQSFPLDTTHTAYSLGFLWDPNDNRQAEGRLRRLDSELQTPCMITYIVPEGSDYQRVLEVLDDKIISTRGYLQGYLEGVIPIDPRKLEVDDFADDDGTDIDRDRDRDE